MKIILKPLSQNSSFVDSSHISVYVIHQKVLGYILRDHDVTTINSSQLLTPVDFSE